MAKYKVIKTGLAFIQATLALASYAWGRLWRVYFKLLSSSCGYASKNCVVLISILLFCILGLVIDPWLYLIAALQTIDLLWLAGIRRLKHLVVLVKLLSFKSENSVATADELLQQLHALGMSAAAIDNIMQVPAEQELLIGEWGALEQLWSAFGQIPALGQVIDDWDSFSARKQVESQQIPRNRVQLVRFQQRIVLKKTFVLRKRFFNDVFAYMQLQGISGVPRLFHANWRQKIVYRELIVADNLSHLMAQAGISLQEQEVVDQLPNATLMQLQQTPDSRREHITQYLQLRFGDNFKQSLRQCLAATHQRRMTFFDICYGNVLLLAGNQPCLSDFDSSDWHLSNDRCFVNARIHDWTRVNLLFDCAVPTPNDLPELFAYHALQMTPSKLSVRVLLNDGTSLGDASMFDSPQWLKAFIISKLPDRAPKRLVHLGVQTGAMASALLSLPTLANVILENRAPHKALALAICAVQQLLDNCEYPLSFVEQAQQQTQNWQWLPGDVVCCFKGFDGLSASEIQNALQAIPTSVGVVILEGLAARHAAVLQQQGFRVEAPVKFPLSQRQFVFAYPILG